VNSSTIVSAKPDSSPSTPVQAGLLLTTLIVAAAVANLPLAMANVALPSIGADFLASQTQLNLVAVGYSLGLACSVLWLGALGDRYGRKLMLLLGVSLAMPTALLTAYAPSIEILILGRLTGGFAAGMVFPTTLSLIAAIWPAGPSKTRSIALWQGTGSAINSTGPLLAGLLLTWLSWHAVFLAILPVAAVALVMALKFVPAHVHESSDPVDNLGGLLSVVLVGSLVLGINTIAVPGSSMLVIGLLTIAVVVLVLFVVRQRRYAYPLYNLKVAARPTFWVAAVGGVIVFGALMGSMFIGQQFLQNVLGYSPVAAGAAILPAGILMILVAPRSAKLIQSRGSRFTLLSGYLFVLLGFLTMLLLWNEGIPYWMVGLGYAFLGVGVGLGGTPAAHSLTASVPVTDMGMASGTADLQRDLGSALFNSFFGALLAIGYASAMAASLAASNDPGAPSAVTGGLEMSYAGAQSVAAQYPQYAEQITAAAKTAFLAGDQYAYIAGILAVLIGGVLVFFVFPKKDKERELTAEYRIQDMADAAPTKRSSAQDAATPQEEPSRR
jgi:DHA2 family multidrug resistance protein-like MFS transporter